MSQTGCTKYYADDKRVNWPSIPEIFWTGLSLSQI